MKLIKWIFIIFGAVAFLVIGLIVFFVLFSGNSEKRMNNHPMIGQVFSAGEKVFYMEDCNNFASCGETKRHKEVNRSLECKRLNNTVTPIYNKSYEIPETTTFELIELYQVTPRGINAVFSGGYKYAVLKDNNGVLSTQGFSIFDEDGITPFYFYGGEVCTNSIDGDIS